MDRTGHPKGHVKSLGAKSANRTLLNNEFQDNLPVAYAQDKSKRTDLQKESFRRQNPAYAKASSVQEAIVVKETQKSISDLD